MPFQKVLKKEEAWTAKLERQWVDWGCFKADKREVQMLNLSSVPYFFAPETAILLLPPYQAHFQFHLHQEKQEWGVEANDTEVQKNLFDAYFELLFDGF